MVRVTDKRDKRDFAKEFSIWCLGKEIPNDVKKLEAFVRKFIKESKFSF